MKLEIPLTPDDTRHANLTLPDDLSAAEVDRLIQVLRALAIADDPSALDIPIPEWEPSAHPTPAQWVDWFDRCPPDHRLAVAERLISDSQAASECFLMNHKNRIAELEQRTGDPA